MLYIKTWKDGHAQKNYMTIAPKDNNYKQRNLPGMHHVKQINEPKFGNWTECGFLKLKSRENTKIKNQNTFEKKFFERKTVNNKENNAY